MAEHAMIARYLAELRRTLARHRDVDDLVDEVADHLLSSVHSGLARGLDGDTAERQTLEAFGDPILVARVYASERHGGFAMPTRFTHAAGTLLIAAGTAWIVSFVLMIGSSIAERTRPWEGLPMVLYQLGAAALLLGAVAMAAGILGVYVRHRRSGALALVALALLGLGIVATAIAWAFSLWAPLVGGGAVLLAVWMRRHDMAPRGPVLWLGAGGAAAALSVAVLLATVGFDGIDTPGLAVLFTALTAFATGVIGLGRWLRSERPLDDPEEALVA